MICFRMSQVVFEYKCTFLDPVDWRPREFNTAADPVANCVFAAAQNISTLGENELIDNLQGVVGIQVYSDGGYVEGIGAAAFVILLIRDTGEQLAPILFGARGIMMANAQSAFHAEVAALDAATEILEQIARILNRR